MFHLLFFITIRVSLPMLVPRHLSGRLLTNVKALDSFYEWEIPKNLYGDCRLLHLTIGTLHLKIPRCPALATVSVFCKLLQKQKATFRTAMYLLIIHAERFHDFLRLVHVSRQTMSFREDVTPCFQIVLKA